MTMPIFDIWIFLLISIVADIALDLTGRFDRTKTSAYIVGRLAFVVMLTFIATMRAIFP